MRDSKETLHECAVQVPPPGEAITAWRKRWQVGDEPAFLKSVSEDRVTGVAPWTVRGLHDHVDDDGHEDSHDIGAICNLAAVDTTVPG